MNQRELQDKIKYESLKWFYYGCEKFGIDSEQNNFMVEFFSRGTMGGSAVFYSSEKRAIIRINIVLAMDNLDEYINVIIPHEVAHIICDIRYGNIVRGYTRTGKAIYDSHGAHWQHVMRLFGKQPSRCHNMDVSKVEVKKTIKRYIYECPACRREFKFTKQKHDKACAYNGWFCKHCNDSNVRVCFTGEIRSIK